MFRRGASRWLLHSLRGHERRFFWSSSWFPTPPSWLLSLASAGSFVGVSKGNPRCDESTGRSRSGLPDLGLPDLNDFRQLVQGLAKLKGADPSKRQDEVGHLLAFMRSQVPRPPNDPLVVVQALKQELQAVSDVLAKEFGEVDLAEVHPFAVRYCMAEMCQLRTPGWKDEAHLHMHQQSLGFTLDLSTDEPLFLDLLEHCKLADAAYADTEEGVQSAIESGTEGRWELVGCTTEASPGAPAHFLAMRQPSESTNFRGAVVLAVRGTKEVADVLTDALVDGAPFEGGVAHAGVVRAAESLCATYADALRSLEEKGYDVVVVGHSLGAATAAAVAIRLRGTCGLERARCICFAPPATVDVQKAEECASYVMSVVHDDDLIPRSQVKSLVDLHNKLVQYDWLPFAKEEVRQLFALAPPWLRSAIDCEDAAAKLNGVLEDMMKSWRRSCGQKPDAEATEAVSGNRHLLCIPGYIVHMYRSDVAAGYSAARVTPSFLESLELSETMVTDHFLDGYLAALKALAEAAKHRALEDARMIQELLPLGAEGAKGAVEQGVRLAYELRSKAVAAAHRRPDTS